MPLQRQKPHRLTPLPPPAARGETLEELLGTWVGRPGDLHEPARIPVPTGLVSAARGVGLPTSLALAVSAERALVVREVTGDARTISALLDKATSAPPRLALSAAYASYARTLIAALNGRLPRHEEADSVSVVPTRLTDRLRAVPDLELQPGALRGALEWELAAVRCGRTITEWALRELLAASYPASASRQELAAASAAR
jgi:hypothetical protein